MHYTKRISKYLFRGLLLTMLVLLILAALIQIPAVQQHLTGSLTNYLQKKLKTEVKIEAIQLKLPESLALKGFYLADRQQDTLINVEELVLNFKLNKLWSQQIQFDKITLKQGKATYHIGEENTNFSFILDAFSSKNKTAETTQKGTTNNWQLTFNDADLQVEEVDFSYLDDKKALYLTTQIGKVNGKIQEIDLFKQRFHLGAISIANSKINVDLTDVGNRKADSTKKVVNYLVQVQKIEMANMDVVVKSADWNFNTHIEEGVSKKGLFEMKGKDIKIEFPYFQLSNTTLAYDRPTKSPKKGFDHNHIVFNKANIEGTHFNYLNVYFTANIAHFSGIENSGLTINDLQTQLDFSKAALGLTALQLKTPNTNITSESLLLEYPFLSKESVEITDLKVISEFSAQAKNSKDLTYFYTPLDTMTFWKSDSITSAWTINTKLNGTLASLGFSHLDFNGFDSKINASGRVKNLHKIEKLRLDININQLETNKKIVGELIPYGVLPNYIQLPDDIALVGTINGNLQRFQSTLTANTFRPNAPFPTKIKAAINGQNIMDLPNAFLDIQIDTFLTSKADLLAYLPPKALPDYVNLPDKFRLAGTIKGPLAKLDSDLQLLTFRNEKANQITAIGGISGLFTAGQPVFDIALDADDIGQEELAAFLPDSLLPAYFQLPLINKIKGILKGNLAEFITKFQVESAAGNWIIDAASKDEKYHLYLDVENLPAADLFSPNYLDNLLGYSLAPLTVKLELDGQGYDFSNPTAYADLFFSAKNSIDTTALGVLVTGKLEKQFLSAILTAEEEEIDLTSRLKIDYTKALPQASYNLGLNHLDLQKLYGLDQSFLLKGTIKGTGEGINLDTLSGKLSLSNFEILYTDSIEKVEQLTMLADFDNGNNAVNITSDFIDANLEGSFQIPRIVEVLEQQMASYWKVDATNDLLGKTADQFTFDFSLHRPELLTLGYISGLTQLSPFELKGNYHNQQQHINVIGKIPYIKYQQFAAENLTLNLETVQGKVLAYQIDGQRLIAQKVVDVQNVSTFGRLENQMIHNTVQALDDEGAKRIEVKSTLCFDENRTAIWSLLPEQLLNYEKWETTANNEIKLSEKEVIAKNWKLFQQEESVEIRTDQPQELDIIFKQFDLKLVSDIINPTANYVGGILEGNFAMTNPLENPIYTTNLRVDSLAVLAQDLGNLSLKAKKQNEDFIQTNGVLKGNGNDLVLKGNYNLSNPENALDMDLNIAALSLKNIEPFLEKYIGNSAGKLQGKLAVKGSIQKPILDGAVNFKEAAFDIDIGKTRLSLGEQPLLFDANGIEFKDLEITDANGSKGIMSSYLLTEDYRTYQLNSTIEVLDFLILNTTAKDNDLYYGTLKVDALATLSGDIKAPVLEVMTRPKKGADLTYVYQPLSSRLELHEGIVEFVQPEKDTILSIINQQLIEVPEEINLKVIVKMEVNDGLNFKAITDPITGDYFEGKAKGGLIYTQYPDGALELTGNLEAIEGKYLFTYQKLVRREFEVKPGSTFNWSGDPYNPTLDATVVYKTRTSAYPLLLDQGNSSADGINRAASRNQLFQVNMKVGGTLANTTVTAELEYPNEEGNSNNSDIRTAIDRINQDPGLQNTQGLSLLLFNGFMAQNLENSAFRMADISGNINNIITQELNNLVNRYIKFVELDFGFDANTNSNNNDNEGNELQGDFRVSIRKRLMNDRLIISLDGKTTSESDKTDSDAQTFLDNITVEYALTPEGQLRIKLYNQRDYDDFLGGTGLKYGGALVFSKEFQGIRLGKRKE